MRTLAVVAAPGLVRLVNGTKPTEGRLEVAACAWAWVCDKGFNDTDASVACKQAGLGVSGRAFYNSHTGYGPLSYIGLACSGAEADLAACPSEGGTCYKSQAVGVSCSGTPAGEVCSCGLRRKLTPAALLNALLWHMSGLLVSHVGPRSESLPVLACRPLRQGRLLVLITQCLLCRRQRAVQPAERAVQLPSQGVRQPAQLQDSGWRLLQVSNSETSGAIRVHLQRNKYDMYCPAAPCPPPVAPLLTVVACCLCSFTTSMCEYPPIANCSARSTSPTPSTPPAPSTSGGSSGLSAGVLAGAVAGGIMALVGKNPQLHAAGKQLRVHIGSNRRHTSISHACSRPKLCVPGVSFASIER